MVWDETDSVIRSEGDFALFAGRKTGVDRGLLNSRGSTGGQGLRSRSGLCLSFELLRSLRHGSLTRGLDDDRSGGIVGSGCYRILRA